MSEDRNCAKHEFSVRRKVEDRGWELPEWAQSTHFKYSYHLLGQQTFSSNLQEQTPFSADIAGYSTIFSVFLSGQSENHLSGAVESRG